MGPKFADDPESKVFPGRWTAGCVALSNWNAQQIAALVQVGTPVEIIGEVKGYRHNFDPKAELAWSQYQHRKAGRVDESHSTATHLSPVKYARNSGAKKSSDSSGETDMDLLLARLGKDKNP
jgi:hypothetical protein